MFGLGCASAGDRGLDRSAGALERAGGEEGAKVVDRSALLSALPALAARLPKTLVTEADRERIERIVAGVSGASVGCFECRLGGTALGTDFHTFHRPEELSTPLGCHAVIFEFDAHADGGAGTPSVFFSLHPSFGGSPARVMSLVDEQLDGAFGEVRAGIARVLSELPEEAAIGQVGFMLGRAPARVRLNVDTIALDGVERLLRKLNWAGDATALRKQLAPLAAACDGFQLALDVGAELDTRIGIECFIGSPSAGGHDWEGLLDILRSSSLCSESEAQAILAWPGFQSADVLPAASPLARFLGPRTFLCLINHFKVVFDGATARQAKAYLLFADHRRR